MDKHVNAYTPVNATELDCPIRRAAKWWSVVSSERNRTPEELEAAACAYFTARGLPYKPPKAYKWCPHMGGWCRETSKPETQKGRE